MRHRDTDARHPSSLAGEGGARMANASAEARRIESCCRNIEDWCNRLGSPPDAARIPVKSARRSESVASTCSVIRPDRALERRSLPEGRAGVARPYWCPRRGLLPGAQYLRLQTRSAASPFRAWTKRYGPSRRSHPSRITMQALPFDTGIHPRYRTAETARSRGGSERPTGTLSDTSTPCMGRWARPRRCMLPARAEACSSNTHPEGEGRTA